MDNRVWGVVALGVGVLLTLAMFLVMSGDPATQDAAERAAATAGKQGGKPGKLFKKGNKRVAEVNDLTTVREVRPEQIAARQRMVEQIRERGLGGPAAPNSPDGSGIFSLDEDGVKAAIDAHRAELDACFRSVAAASPATSPTATLAIAVAAEEGRAWGAVSGVSSEVGPSLDDCVSTVLVGTRFAAVSDTTLRYPMTFRTD